jgi:hypothetical protein
MLLITVPPTHPPPKKNKKKTNKQQTNKQNKEKTWKTVVLGVEQDFPGYSPA